MSLCNCRPYPSRMYLSVFSRATVSLTLLLPEWSTCARALHAWQTLSRAARSPWRCVPLWAVLPDHETSQETIPIIHASAGLPALFFPCIFSTPLWYLLQVGTFSNYAFCSNNFPLLPSAWPATIGSPCHYITLGEPRHGGPCQPSPACPHRVPPAHQHELEQRLWLLPSSWVPRDGTHMLTWWHAHSPHDELCEKCEGCMPHGLYAQRPHQVTTCEQIVCGGLLEICLKGNCSCSPDQRLHSVFAASMRVCVYLHVYICIESS